MVKTHTTVTKTIMPLGHISSLYQVFLCILLISILYLHFQGGDEIEYYTNNFQYRLLLEIGTPILSAAQQWISNTVCCLTSYIQYCSPLFQVASPVHLRVIGNPTKTITAGWLIKGAQCSA